MTESTTLERFQKLDFHTKRRVEHARDQLFRAMGEDMPKDVLTEVAMNWTVPHELSNIEIAALKREQDEPEVDFEVTELSDEDYRKMLYEYDMETNFGDLVQTKQVEQEALDLTVKNWMGNPVMTEEELRRAVLEERGELGELL